MYCIYILPYKGLFTLNKSEDKHARKQPEFSLMSAVTSFICHKEISKTLEGVHRVCPLGCATAYSFVIAIAFALTFAQWERTLTVHTSLHINFS